MAYINLLSYLAELFLEWDIFHIKVVEKTKTYIFMLSNFFLKKIVPLWDNVEKYGRGRQATGDNTVWWTKYSICIPGN